MSSFLTKNNDGTYIKKIERVDVCKWKINEICCNDKSPYLADYPSLFCECKSKKDCMFFEKEDGVINDYS